MKFIREINTFKYFNKEFKAGDLTRWDFLFIFQNEQEGFKKILLEYNKRLPELNQRQLKEFLRILYWEKEEEKWEKIKPEDLLIIEWQIMHHLHQSREEMRKRTLEYFMEMYKQLPYIIWTKDPKEKWDNPDKKTFKKEFWEFYN